MFVILCAFIKYLTRLQEYNNKCLYKKCDVICGIMMSIFNHDYN